MGEPQLSVDMVSMRLNHLMFINRRMSQRQLAMQLGIHPANVSSKFTGRTAWNLHELVALCDIFEVSADYLLGRESIESAQPVKTEGPVSVETGPSASVAGAGFEPTTSGL